MTAEEAVAGLNGWFRWKNWSAHFFVSGVQQCNTQHLLFAELTPEPQPPSPAELSMHGQPFGRVCQRCLKVYGRSKK